MCGLSALSASGRFSVIVALCPSTSYLDVDVHFVGHLPPNSGARLSRNAARPSLKSVVRQESSRLNSSCVMACSRVACWPYLMACLASPIATVGPDASRVSSSRRRRRRPAARRAVDQAPVRRVGSADLLAEQQHLLRPRQTDQPGQQPRRARIRAEAAGDERLPEHRIVGGHGEVGGQRQVAAKADGPAAHAAHHGQMNGVDEFDHPMGGVGNAPDQIAGAGPLARALVADPVRARAEVVARAANVDGAQRVVGRGVGQRVDERVDHRMAQRVTPRRAIEREAQDIAVPRCRHRAVGVDVSHR